MTYTVILNPDPRNVNRWYPFSDYAEAKDFSDFWKGEIENEDAILLQKLSREVIEIGYTMAVIDIRDILLEHQKGNEALFTKLDDKMEQMLQIRKL